MEYTSWIDIICLNNLLVICLCQVELQFFIFKGYRSVLQYCSFCMVNVHVPMLSFILFFAVFGFCMQLFLKILIEMAYITYLIRLKEQSDLGLHMSFCQKL